MEPVNLAQAKARLSELVARAEAGEDVRIARRGRPAVRLVAEEPPKAPIDWDALKALTDSLPMSELTVVEMRRQDLL